MKHVTELVASFPAYDVVKPRVDTLTNLPVFKDNDTVALASRGYKKLFTFGSVVSSAIEFNDDPIKEYNRALELGHETHWLNANPITLSANKREKETHYEINIGDEVVFEGIVLRVEKDWYDNLKLVKVTTRDELIEANSK